MHRSRDLGSHSRSARSHAKQTPFVIPAPDELLNEVLGLDKLEGVEAIDASVARAAARPLPSRFSLRRADAAHPNADRIDRELGPLLDAPGEIRWEGAIFERVSSIELTLGEVEERLAKRIPEVEERLLHLLEVRLLRLERELDTRLADLSEHIARMGEGRRYWQALSLAGIAVLVALAYFAIVKLV